MSTQELSSKLGKQRRTSVISDNVNKSANRNGFCRIKRQGEEISLYSGYFYYWRKASLSRSGLQMGQYVSGELMETAGE